ncbi:MAG: exopolysaccharide biosynthesis polyprenyl glycosylphosphotransferase [Eubacterium sp.]|nr:exopolysaccharide biosynthesis polyprenyl glycosylphosphotransferase [Eubacterium sp.]
MNIGNISNKTDNINAGTIFPNDKFTHRLALRTVKLLNVLIMTTLFSIVWYQLLAEKLYSPFYTRGNWVIVVLYFILYYLFGKTYEAFLVSYNRISDMVLSQVLALVMTNFILLLITWLLVRGLYNPLPYLLLLGLQLTASVLWCTWAHRWYFKHFIAKRSVIIWDMRKGLKALINDGDMKVKFNIVGDYYATDVVNKVENELGDEIFNGIETVFLTGVHSHDRNVIIKYCVEHNITVFLIPRIGDIIMSGAHKVHLFHLPFLRLDRYNPAPEFLFIKRTFDIVISAIGLVILSPLYLVLTILVKKQDGGPALYKQVRLTKDGKKFNVLKFRSMRVDAEKDGVARLSTGENDDRITPIGKFMRAHRLDELPQLVNIFRGDMSIVGPRPERPEIAEQYEKELPEFRLRLQCKCGLTGYAQVYGKYNTTPYDKLQMDLMYIANPSIAQDLEIMFATVKILFMKESTEGVAEGQTTASAGSVENTGVSEDRAAEK